MASRDSDNPYFTASRGIGKRSREEIASQRVAAKGKRQAVAAVAFQEARGFRSDRAVIAGLTGAAYVPDGLGGFSYGVKMRRAPEEVYDAVHSPYGRLPVTDEVVDYVRRSVAEQLQAAAVKAAAPEAA